MIRRPILLGVPAAILWLFFLLVSPLPAVIVLLAAVAWRDHHLRRAAIKPLADDETMTQPSRWE